MSERIKRTKWYHIEVWDGTCWMRLSSGPFAHLKDARAERDRYKMNGTVARVVQYQTRVLP